MGRVIVYGSNLNDIYDAVRKYHKEVIYDFVDEIIEYAKRLGLMNGDSTEDRDNFCDIMEQDIGSLSESEAKTLYLMNCFIRARKLSYDVVRVIGEGDTLWCNNPVYSDSNTTEIKRFRIHKGHGGAVIIDYTDDYYTRNVFLNIVSVLKLMGKDTSKVTMEIEV